MKIFNYSDLPVNVAGNDIHDHLIHVHNSFHNIYHNGELFLPPKTEDRNIIVTISNHPANDEYVYKIDQFAVPNIYPFVGLFTLFFGFFIVIKLVQKLKTR